MSCPLAKTTLKEKGGSKSCRRQSDDAGDSNEFKHAATSGYGTAGPEFVRRIVAEAVLMFDQNDNEANLGMGTIW